MNLKVFLVTESSPFPPPSLLYLFFSGSLPARSDPHASPMRAQDRQASRRSQYKKTIDTDESRRKVCAQVSPLRRRLRPPVVWSHQQRQFLLKYRSHNHSRDPQTRKWSCFYISCPYIVLSYIASSLKRPRASGPHPLRFAPTCELLTDYCYTFVPICREITISSRCGRINASSSWKRSGI